MGIFTFHSLPQIGGICPVPDSDVRSSQASQASTNAHHPGRENNKPFLGRICMSPPPLSDCSIVGAKRQMEQSRLSWLGARSALHRELTSKRFLGQTEGWGRAILRATREQSRWGEKVAAGELWSRRFICICQTVFGGFSHWHFRLVEVSWLIIRY